MPAKKVPVGPEVFLQGGRPGLAHANMQEEPFLCHGSEHAGSLRARPDFPASSEFTEAMCNLGLHVIRVGTVNLRASLTWIIPPI